MKICTFTPKTSITKSETHKYCLQITKVTFLFFRSHIAFSLQTFNRSGSQHRFPPTGSAAYHAGEAFAEPGNISHEGASGEDGLEKNLNNIKLDKGQDNVGVYVPAQS